MTEEEEHFNDETAELHDHFLEEQAAHVAGVEPPPWHLTIPMHPPESHFTVANPVSNRSHSIFSRMRNDPENDHAVPPGTTILYDTWGPDHPEDHGTIITDANFLDTLETAFGVEINSQRDVHRVLGNSVVAIPTTRYRASGSNVHTSKTYLLGRISNTSLQGRNLHMNRRIENSHLRGNWLEVNGNDFQRDQWIHKWKIAVPR